MSFLLKANMFFLMLFAATLPGPALYAAERHPPESVRLLLQWTPQAQFAGFYVAYAKGFYQKRGITPEILHGGPDCIVSDLLEAGSVDFGTMFLVTAIERRSAGIPLVNTGQFLHHSSLMLVTRVSSGVDAINRLDGKKVAIWANEFQIQPRLLFREAGINVIFVPLASSMELFLRGAVTATSAMWYNEFHTILSSGIRENELHTFFFRDTAYDYPEDGIYCLEKTCRKAPWIAKALTEGTLEGWSYAFAHEQEALDIVMQIMSKANMSVNLMHQRWMIRRMRDIMLQDGVVAGNGILKRNMFNKVTKQLLESGTILHPVSYDGFCRRKPE